MFPLTSSSTEGVKPEGQSAHIQGLRILSKNGNSTHHKNTQTAGSLNCQEIKMKVPFLEMSQVSKLLIESYQGVIGVFN